MNYIEPTLNEPYDSLESQAEAMSAAQIEHDKATLADVLYCATMICTEAGDTRLDEYLPTICRAVGIDYPPRLIGNPAASNTGNLAGVLA